MEGDFHVARNVVDLMSEVNHKTSRAAGWTNDLVGDDDIARVLTVAERFNPWRSSPRRLRRSLCRGRPGGGWRRRWLRRRRSNGWWRRNRLGLPRTRETLHELAQIFRRRFHRR